MEMKEDRIEREKRTVGIMVDIYCRHHLGLSGVEGQWKELLAYAHARLDGCRFADRKPVCKDCPIHCYSPAMREKIRSVMRWSGPRMVIYAPKELLRHLLDKLLWRKR